MAGKDLPDVITPAQAAKFGLVGGGSDGTDLPDVLTPDQVQRFGLAQPTLAGKDAGPAARRAAAGLSPGPRQLSDEEAGVESAPASIQGLTPKTGPLPGVVPYRAEDAARRFAGLTPAERAHEQAESNANAAFLVSMIPAGLAGRVAGGATEAAAGRILPKAVAPIAAPIAAGAVEGGTVSKVMGGSFGTGALLGAGFGAAGKLADAVAKGAPARVAERSLRNVTEDVRQSTANKVTAKAGPEGASLRQVVERNPELRKALSIQAKEKPVAALKTVKATKDAANEARNADFDRMQEHYADKPPSSQASISGLLDDIDKLAEQHPADLGRQDVLSRARDEIAKLGDRLRKAQKLPPANGDYSGTVISPKDLRDLEQTIGERAYEGIPLDKRLSVKRRVNNELYQPIASQIHGLAENTPGVNAKKFAETGKDISTLIPVEEALQIKVDRAAQGKMTGREILTNAAHGVSHVAGLAGGYAAHGVTGAVVGSLLPAVGRGALSAAEGLGRRLDYRLSETAPARSLPSLGVPQLSIAATGAKERDYARDVTNAMAGGMSLADAVGAH